MKNKKSDSGNPSPAVSLEVAFPEGHCIFDVNKVHSWSLAFENCYSVILDRLCVGLDYVEFLRLLFEYGDVRDSLWIEDPDTWLKTHCNRAVPYSEFVYRCSDGRWLSNRFITLDANKWVLTCTDITDITDISVDQGLMNIQFKKFKRFASLASNWYWELDECLCYLFHSSHQQPLAGDDAKGLVGESRILKLDGMVVADDQLHEHNRCLREHLDVNVVLSWQREGGAVVYSHILAEPQFGEGGVFSGYLGSGRDITEQKELEK